MSINLWCKFQIPNEQYSLCLEVFLLVARNLQSAYFSHFVKNPQGILYRQAEQVSSSAQLALETVQLNITVYSAALILYCLIKRIFKPNIEFVFTNVPFTIEAFFPFTKLRSTNFWIFAEQALLKLLLVSQHWKGKAAWLPKCFNSVLILTSNFCQFLFHFTKQSPDLHVNCTIIWQRW